MEQDETKGALGLYQFEVPRSESRLLPNFFKQLEKKGKSLGVKDFQLSLATLEEVFLAIAHQEEVQEKKKPKKKKVRFSLC